MTPEQIKGVRRQLACTAKELAKTLGVDQATVLAWEKGELFPTKKYVQQMNELIQKKQTSPTLFSSSAPPPSVTDPVIKAIADPQVWALFRKMLVHRDLREAVQRLAADYPDPLVESERPAS